jgi:hypothetical protein
LDEVEPPEHPLHADALSDLSRLMPEIVRLTQLSTRWTGILIVRGLEFGLAGQKHGWCGISIRDDVLAVSEYRWSTMIHEGLHSVSAAFSPTRLDPTNQRWEEAIVEQTQRILRTELLESLGVTLDQAVLGARDDTHRYNIYIRALEIQRNAEGQDAWEFYLELLGSPRPVRVRKLMTAWRALAEERDKGL